MLKNVLKDGKTVKDMKGHLVTRESNPRIYEFLEKSRGENYGGKFGRNDGRSNERN